MNFLYIPPRNWSYSEFSGRYVQPKGRRMVIIGTYRVCAGGSAKAGRGQRVHPGMYNARTTCPHVYTTEAGKRNRKPVKKAIPGPEGRESLQQQYKRITLNQTVTNSVCKVILLSQTVKSLFMGIFKGGLRYRPQCPGDRPPARSGLPRGPCGQ